MLAERLRTLDSQFVLSQKQLWEMAFKNGGQSQEMQELKVPKENIFYFVMMTIGWKKIFC
jgi:hypothetical protein